MYYYGDYKYNYEYNNDRMELINRNILNYLCLSDSKYVDYLIKKIDKYDEGYYSDLLIIEEIIINKKFFGLYKKEKIERHILNFDKHIIVENEIEHLVEILIDDYNKIAYWKYKKNITKEREEFKRREEYLKRKAEYFNKRWEESCKNRDNWKYFKDEQQHKREVPNSSSKLQEYLKFLNIGNKEYNKKSLQAHYRKLSKMYHPDMPNGNTEMMQKINVAYEYIMATLGEK